MAEGIRIRHRVLRADPTVAPTLIVAVRDLTEPLGTPPAPYVPPACSLCGIDAPGHALVNDDGTFQRYKVRHVVIDTEGYGLVSAGVYEGLKHLADHGGFDLTNTISNPPRQTINMDANGSGTPAVMVHHKLQQLITDQLVNN